MDTMMPGQAGPPMGQPPAPAPYDQADEMAAPAPQRQHSKPIDAAEVQRLWVQANKHLLRDRINYQLNLSFYLGEQWVMPINGTLQEIEWGNNRERDSRITVDKFGPRTRNLLARFMPEDLAFESRAEGLSDAALHSKRIREQLLESERTQHNWEDVRVDATMDTLLGGTAAISVDWDPTMEDDPDDSMIDPFSQETFPGGGLRLTALSIMDFALEPGNKQWTDARWCIRATSAPPEAVWDRYPSLKAKPVADAHSLLGARHRTMIRDLYGGQDEDMKATAVYIYYERPTAREPGQIAHVVNGQVVERELAWPFPFKTLNLWVFRGDRIRGRWTGATLLNTARSIQMGFNNIRSTVMEHARKAANARLAVPEGSVQDEDAFTTDVAEILYWQPDPTGAKPGWLEAPQIPRWLSQEADRLETDMDDIFHTHAISRGEQVGDRNSGLALSILAEKDDTPLTFIARDQSHGWGRIGEMALMMLAAKKQGGQATLYGASGPVPIQWSTEDIGPNPKVVVPLKSTMPRTRVATQALIKDLLQSVPSLAEGFDVGMLGKYLNIDDAEMFVAKSDPDAAIIQWENEMLAAGSACTPAVYNDQAKHIAGHEAEQNTPDYQFRTPDLQALMDEHIQAHRMLLMQDPVQMQMGGQMPGGPQTPGGPPEGAPPEGLPPGMAPPPGLPPGAPPGPPAAA